MMKRTFKHTAFRCGLLVVSSAILSGCFEVNFPDIDSYYNALGNTVEIINTDQAGLTSSSKNISVKEFLFNDESVNDIKTAALLDSNYYEYITIHVTEAMNIGDFAIYVKTDLSVQFMMRLFISNECPSASSVRSFAKLSKNPLTQEEYSYSDRLSDPVVELSLTANQGVWSSFYNSLWPESVDPKSVRIEKDQYLIIQFLNNTGYGADLYLKPVSFVPVNLIVSPKNEKY